MKLTRTLKVGILAVAFGSLVCANAADFSKKSDKELISLSGVVKAEEFADYELEIAKRMKAKSEKEAKDFREKLKAQYEKATENMSVKEYREYKKATHEAMKKRVENMSEKELKESGLPPHRHFKACKAECKDKKHCEPKKK